VPTRTWTPQEIGTLARQQCPAAIQRLAYLAQHAESEAAQVAACNSLLDRGLGKAVQPVVSDLTVTLRPLAIVSPTGEALRVIDLEPDEDVPGDE
jgi:hypothetical protein